jgi:hypothetical protein
MPDSAARGIETRQAAARFHFEERKPACCRAAMTIQRAETGSVRSKKSIVAFNA